MTPLYDDSVCSPDRLVSNRDTDLAPKLVPCTPSRLKGEVGLVSWLAADSDETTDDLATALLSAHDRRISRHVSLS